MHRETIGAAELWLGDAREIVPTLATRGVAVVSDPPYGISYVHGPGGRGAGHKPGRKGNSLRGLCRPIAGDSEAFDPGFLLHFPELVLWGADHYAAHLPHGRWLCWDKLAGRASWDDHSDAEYAWHSRRGAARIFRHLWKGIAKGSEHGVARQHPTQKPTALFSWCLDQLHRPAEVIADPFMGSGSAGVAAVRAGRRFIGIELDRTYFEVACRRIEAEVRQPTLFNPQSAAPAQLQGQFL